MEFLTIAQQKELKKRIGFKQVKACANCNYVERDYDGEVRCIKHYALPIAQDNICNDYE